MKRIDLRIAIGAGLILLGMLLLLERFGLFRGASAIFWGLVFLAGGIYFFNRFANNTIGEWWAVIPGSALAGIGVDSLLSGVLRDWGGFFFLGFLGAGFLAVYFSGRERWWAIIPGDHRGLRVESARRFGVPCRSGYQVFRDGIDGYQHLHRQRAILDGDAELLLEAEHQFQRVDRVESEAAGPEQRLLIGDLLDRRGKIQPNGQDFPDLLFRFIHFQRDSSFFPLDEPAGMHLRGISLS